MKGYRIRNRLTGEWYNSKIYSNIGHAKAAVRNIRDHYRYNSNKDLMLEYDIIEYELQETNVKYYLSLDNERTWKTRIG